MLKMVISFKIDERIKAALKDLAKKENRSLSNYVTTLLLEHLKAKDIDWHKLKDKPTKK